MFRLQIFSRDYRRFQLLPLGDDPTEAPLVSSAWTPRSFYHGDIFVWNAEDPIDRPRLHTRSLPRSLVGILDYESKYHFPPSKKGIPTYLFHPLSPHFPDMIVSSANAYKYAYKNIYVVVSVMNPMDPWMEYPRATLQCELGTVREYSHYEKALSLALDIPYTPKQTDHALFPSSSSSSSSSCSSVMTSPRYPHEIITVDPPGCRDIDDGFSVWKDLETSAFHLDIHISNVFVLFQQLGLTPDHVTKRISSIYLPHGILPMLPDWISCGQGSLLEGTTRELLSCCITRSATGEITWDIVAVHGTITRNLSYDSTDAIPYMEYATDIAEIYRVLSQTTTPRTIGNTHEFIEVLMLLYNHLFSKLLSERHRKPWIGRKQETPLRMATYEYEVPHANSPSQSSSDSPIYHASLGLSCYTHASSPLRRWVDLKNQELFCSDSESLLQHPALDLSSVNGQSRRIREFQYKCHTMWFAQMLFDLYPRGKESMIRLLRVDPSANRLVWRVEDHESVQFYTHIDHPLEYRLDKVTVRHQDPLTYVYGDTEYQIQGVYTCILFGTPDPLRVGDSVRISFD